MKRLLLATFLVLLLVLSGCGEQNSSSEPQQDAEAQGRPAARAQDVASTENGQITNGKIAFTRNDEIYIMNSDGSGVTRLTDNSSYDAGPAFSPDGKKIAFTSTRDGNHDQIYVMNSDGSDQTNISNNSANEYNPDFSPDGSRIVFDSYRDGNDEIYIMNSDGSGVTRLTNNPADDKDPSFSPDGSRIVFMSARDGNGEIYTMNADGTDQTNVSNNSAEDEIPSFSPDGSKIIFDSQDGNTYGEIYVMNSDGSGVTNLTKNPAVDYGSAFSPDGSRIVFASQRNYHGGGYEIYAMNADGSNPTRLTNYSGDDVFPDWGGAPQSQSTARSPSANSGILTSSEDDGEVASLRQAVGDYYRAAGAEEWAYTYAHLDSRTQSIFTEKEWFRKNQWLWDYNPTIYYIASIKQVSTSQEPLAEVKVRITGEDGSVWNRTTYFVLEDGEWKHRFSQEEIDLFMPDATFEEFVAAQTGASPESTPEPTAGSSAAGVCAGLSDCKMVDTADVDGDGALDEIALVGEPDEYPGTPTPISVRVLLADATILTREIEVESWYRDTAWYGATDFGQVPGEELVIGATSGPHTLWCRVLTYRNGELVELPYPESDPAHADLFYATMWPIDAAFSVYMGVQCQPDAVVIRSVSAKSGHDPENPSYEGRATSWVLDGDQWRMVASEPLSYPDGSSAFEIAGWQCGDLPRGYD